MPAENRCNFCKGLYSLAAECFVVTLTFVHAVMSAIEILIHLDVIHVPNSGKLTDDVVMTPSTNETSSTSQPHDPGGCWTLLHKDLDVTVEILRYTTLVISALFFIEIVCKVIFLRKRFFMDGWQIFDSLVVVLSVGVEITFFLIHEELYCYHPATEAATFIILLRLWRIPRTCNVRKKELRRTFDNEIRYNTQTKVETEKVRKRLEKRVEYLEAVLRNNNLLNTADSEPVQNGNTQVQNGMSVVARSVIHTETMDDRDYTDHVPNGTNCSVPAINIPTIITDDRRGTDLERNDSDKNSGGNDSGIEVKDSFRCERNDIEAYKRAVAAADDDVFESDGSEITAKVEEVEVQIEETSRQKQLPSIASYHKSIDDDEDDVVLLRRKQSSTSAAYCVNQGFENPDRDVTHESITYKSADGIPMTEL